MRSTVESMTKLGLALVLALVLFGCKGRPSMKAFDVSVRLSPEVGVQTVNVDLIGVSNANEPAWSGIELDQYWREDDKDMFRETFLSQGLLHTMDFPAGSNSGPQLLSKNDPIWANWRAQDAMWLFVVAELSETKHRKKLTLNKKRWKRSVNQIDITVGPAGIFTEQSPKPEGK